ncbi:hypothetical protein GYMLUDRAFT_777945 [Collybiopsis luxurians FD-317 M1]|uniref:Uncharacterized protein n=1 Tax=Collybiopsis luxurians FD-317 M1 TaxID=944289 RepID=A0A0D0CN94_9AGAR|nr:hypothetical protein GYMLUDRAFT_777945 [Collybiopsis luxurians FD-317 M1]
MSAQVKNMFDINEQLADDMIAQACIIYIMHVADRKEMKYGFEELHLWDYACQYWLVHARCIEEKQQASPLESLTKKILMDSSNSFLLWRRQYESNQTWGNEWRIGTALYYAAENGLEKTVENILMEKRDVNAQGGRYGNALQAAVQKGNKAVVKLLVENGADMGMHSRQLCRKAMKLLSSCWLKMVQM